MQRFSQAWQADTLSFAELPAHEQLSSQSPCSISLIQLSIHRLFRSSKTGKLYWIGNIIPEHTTISGHPRYPLIIAEVDENTLGLKKATVTQIDTRQKGEGERLQLSNFWIVESQAEKNLEIYLNRLNEHPDEIYTASVYRYTVSFK